MALNLKPSLMICVIDAHSRLTPFVHILFIFVRIAVSVDLSLIRSCISVLRGNPEVSCPLSIYFKARLWRAEHSSIYIFIYMNITIHLAIRIHETDNT